MQQLFSNKKLVIGVGGLVALLLVGIIAMLALLLAGDNNRQSNQSQQTESSGGSDSTGGRSSGFDAGRVSSLSGGVSSYRNLKGLTLRINQIETCNPEVVSAFISVSSDEGDVNQNFGKTDVSVYLDGNKIDNFEFNAVDTAKSPLSNMLLIDHSGSMDANSMNNAKSAAKQYVGKLRFGDQAGLIKFDHVVETLVPMTTDKARVSRAVDTISPRGDTAIFDAISVGIDAVPDCGRKAVTVLTDGEDTASKSLNRNTVIEKASRENLPVFAVGVKSPNFDPAAIREIAEKSGDQYLEANTPSEIAGLYESIDGQLTGQFVANFRMPLKKDGSTHTLKIISNVEGSETGSERSFVF